MSIVRFYFDFISPYSYLALGKLQDIAQTKGYEIEYLPIDLYRAKSECGNTAPRITAIPNKFAYAQADLRRWAAYYDVPFARAGGYEGFDRLNIGTLHARRHGRIVDYVNQVYLRTWGLGGRPNDEALIAEIVGSIGLDYDAFSAFLDSEEAAAEYEEVFRQATSDKVFGVPTFLIGDEMWWGNDRLFMLEKYMAEARA